MRKYILSLLIVFMGTNSFAVEYLNQHQLREKLASTSLEINKECQDDEQQIQDGFVLNRLKDVYKYSDAKAQSCNKQYEKAMKRFCHIKLLTIQQLESIVSDQNMAELSKGFSVKPEATALGAVVIYKMKSKLRQMENMSIMRMSNLVQKSSCEALKQDKAMIGFIKQFTNRLSAELGQTTLSVD